MPEIGIKLDTLLFGSTFHLYPGEPFIPFIGGFFPYPVKIPMRYLRLKIQACLVYAGIRDAHLDQHRVICFRVELYITTGILPLYTVSLQYLPVLPSCKSFKRPVKPGHKIGKGVLWSPAGLAD